MAGSERTSGSPLDGRGVLDPVQITVFGHSVVPYLNAEGFYDTRYVGLARMLYMAGSEFTFTDHFRCELYFAQQTDYRPNPSGLAAFGVVAKWYY